MNGSHSAPESFSGTRGFAATEIDPSATCKVTASSCMASARSAHFSYLLTSRASADMLDLLKNILRGRVGAKFAINWTRRV